MACLLAHKAKGGFINILCCRELLVQNLFVYFHMLSLMGDHVYLEKLRMMDKVSHNRFHTIDTVSESKDYDDYPYFHLQ